LSNLFRHRQVLVAGMRARAEPGDALVHGRGRVRHRAQHWHAVAQVLLDLRGRHSGRHREHRLLRGEEPADLAEEDLEVLWLDRDHDEGGARDGVGVRERRLDAVALGQLVDPLLAPPADDDLLRLAPARGEQTGEQ